MRPLDKKINEMIDKYKIYDLPIELIREFDKDLKEIEDGKYNVEN